MLVLSRRVGESVVIGHDVVVTVLEVRGDVVRVGISAPRTVQVHREEVYRELRESNQDAASSSDAAIDALTARLSRRPPASGPAAAPGASAPAPTAPGNPAQPATPGISPKPQPPRR